jgi:hypothetical protein
MKCYVSRSSVSTVQSFHERCDQRRHWTLCLQTQGSQSSRNIGDCHEDIPWPRLLHDATGQLSKILTCYCLRAICDNQRNAASWDGDASIYTRGAIVLQTSPLWDRTDWSTGDWRLVFVRCSVRISSEISDVRWKLSDLALNLLEPNGFYMYHFL